MSWWRHAKLGGLTAATIPGSAVQGRIIFNADCHQLLYRMVILDEKSMQPPPPPPPYVATGPLHPPPFPNHQYREEATLGALPSHILLQIAYGTFPQVSPTGQNSVERQRKTLYWISVCLRLVNRAFYTACMHVLRSTYLPAYDSLVRPPYSSDPFPLTAGTSTQTPSSPSTSSSSPLQLVQRETQVLDYFIALKVREDVWMDDTEFHLEREESFKDLFDLSQPKSRLEDLVRIYGIREGVVTEAPIQKGKGLPFNSLAVSFSTRRVGVVLNNGGRKRTIVEVARTRDEKLEVAAKKLVKELKVWLFG